MKYTIEMKPDGVFVNGQKTSFMRKGSSRSVYRFGDKVVKIAFGGGQNEHEAEIYKQIPMEFLHHFACVYATGRVHNLPGITYIIQEYIDNGETMVDYETDREHGMFLEYLEDIIGLEDLHSFNYQIVAGTIVVFDFGY